MSKEFSYILLAGKSSYATQFKSDFEQNNTLKITIGVYSSNQIPYYIIKNTKEYIYPFTSKWFSYPDHNSRFSSLNSTNILEEFKELRNKEYSHILNNSKQIISNAINENYEKQIPSTYTNLDNIFKGEQSVVNPENIHIVLEKGKLNVYYDGIYKSNSIICEEGEIYIYKRYSDTWSNVIIDNAICKIFNVSSDRLVTVNKLKAEIIDPNSNLIIEQLDCNKPVKIKVSSKDCNIKIKNILGDKNNISVEMDTKYTTEDVVNIEGKPYSQWKTKAQTKGKNSTIYPIKGKTFIATGKIIIGQYNTRDQIYSLIKAAGGNIAKSKDHYYDYLVTDKHFTHGDNSSSKLEDAERRGIIPISGAQLEEMLRNEGVIQ